MEYYTIKKNEILSFTTKWMALEGIMLSEISQAKKDKYHMFSLVYLQLPLCVCVCVCVCVTES